MKNNLTKQKIIESLESTGHYKKGEVHNIDIIEGETLITGCNSCGKCCRDRQDILLKVGDIYNICKKLKITAEELLTKYCNVYVGHMSHMPIVSIKFRGNVFDDSTVCPFLKKVGENTYHCRIHSHKPNVCRIYPLGRIGVKDIGSDEDKFVYIHQNTTCVPKEQQREYTFNEWLGEDYKIHEDFFREFNKLVSYVHEKIELEKLMKETEKRGQKDTAFSFLLATLYIPKKDLSIGEAIEEYKTRKALIDAFASALKEIGYKSCIKK